jgi:ABC-2 type transporter
MTTIAQPASLPEAVPQDRVGPLAAIGHTLTLAWRSLVQIRHNPMELGDLSLQPLMFVVLFAYVFGGAIAGSPKAYLQFGLAGIICQNALFLTMNTGMALNTDITKGVFDRFRSLPIARSAPLAGRIVADVVRQVWSMAILMVVGTLLGFRIQTNPVDVLAAVALLVAFTLGRPQQLGRLPGAAVGQGDGRGQPDHPGDHRPVAGPEGDRQGPPVAVAGVLEVARGHLDLSRVARATACTWSTGKSPRR